MKRELEQARHPIMPLIRCLARACDPEAAEFIHWGATTQDVLDTGLVLQLRSTHGIVTRDLGEIRRLLAALARRHRDTVQAGRTHGQQALPITFGYKVAVWVAEVDRHLERLAQLEPRVFRGQLAGAVGTLASIGERASSSRRSSAPISGWPSRRSLGTRARDGVAEAVCAYALVGGTLAKIASEVIDLQRTEVAELEEPFHRGKVGSSTMPHKRNPSACEHVVALGRLLHAQVAPALQSWSRPTSGTSGPGVAEQAILPEASCCSPGCSTGRGTSSPGSTCIPSGCGRTSGSWTGSS